MGGAIVFGCLIIALALWDVAKAIRRLAEAHILHGSAMNNLAEVFQIALRYRR